MGEKWAFFCWGVGERRGETQDDKKKTCKARQWARANFPRKIIITYSGEIKLSPLSLMSMFNKGFLKPTAPLLKGEFTS